MRKRWVQTLAAGQRWPDASQASGGPGATGRFNWLRVDNVGTDAVDVLPGPSGGGTGDYTRIFCTVAGNTSRVFNVAGPKPAPGTVKAHPTFDDMWWDQVFLFSANGTTVVLEVADFPIVDQTHPSTPADVTPQPASPLFSTAATGGVVTPASGAVVSGALVPPAGTYDVTFMFAYGATGDVAFNVRTFWNGGAPNAFTLPNPGGNNAAMSPVTIKGLVLDGVHAIGLTAASAGAAGSIYCGAVIAAPAGEV